MSACFTDPYCILVAVVSSDVHCRQTVSVAEIKKSSCTDQTHHESSRSWLRGSQYQWRLYTFTTYTLLT